MHAGLVIYGSLDTVSGGYLYDRQLVRYLQSQGDSVEIIPLPWRSYGQHLLDNHSPDLQALIHYGGYDVVLQDELNHPSLFRLNTVIVPRPSPIISIVHHLRCSEKRPNWQNNLYRGIEQRYLNSVDAFIFNSRTTAAAVESLLKRPHPAVVAPPGRDHIKPYITPDMIGKRAADGPLHLLFVGNIIPRKGLTVVLEALAKLPPDSWVLDIVGDDSVDPAYTAETTRLITQLGVDGSVRLLGRLDDAALAERYAAAHVLVVPSSYEGYGIVYAEAMGFGLPVIATTSGAAAELIDDGVNGFLISPGDATQLAAHLAMLSADRSLLADMSLHALKCYQTLPTWDESMAQARLFILERIASFEGRG
ncbi:MAG: glycosyltransferase family 4 protein [Chloroflexota bacterium]